MKDLLVIEILKNPGNYSVEIVCRALTEILHKTTVARNKDNLSIDFL
jgi:hypothetical protein